jgi:hypothetical protein
MLAQKLLSGGEEEKLYSDDVFSTYLYTGNGSIQTFNNGIALAGRGGLVWIKARNLAVFNNNILWDSARNGTDGQSFGAYLSSDSTASQQTYGSASKPVMPASGFNIASWNSYSGIPYTSWSFRKAPKFFDVVTYTGNGVAGRQISHNLGCEVGMIIVKNITTGGSYWAVYHRSRGVGKELFLNSTDAETSYGDLWSSVTSTQFTVSNNFNVNASGSNYVAYLYAHDTSADGIIQCGSYTGNGSATGPIVTLGWEPQYLMIKNASGTGNWQIIDSMRGMPVGSADATLQANLANAESAVEYVSPTATGFQITSTSSEVNTNASTYIYMAIRRPNKPPTLGTQIYNAITRVGNEIDGYVVPCSGFQPDMCINNCTNIDTYALGLIVNRLVGGNSLRTTGTNSEVSATTYFKTDCFAVPNGIKVAADGLTNGNSFYSYVNHFFRRAPGVFDVVCGTSTAGQQTYNHSLGIRPDLVIIKSRTAANLQQWYVSYFTGTATPVDVNKGLVLNTTAAATATGLCDHLANNNVFRLDAGNDYNTTFVAYLFASLPGISKVGSFTGNGSSQTINCGFTTGARFILIKRTDSTGDWFTWDTTRGIVAGNDPHLSLNTTAAEVTTDDSIDPDPSGFIVNQIAATNINVTSATYIYLSFA